MNKAKVATLAMNTAKRYPEPTLGIAKFAVRRRKGLFQTVGSTRKMSRGAQRLVGRASDPGFRKELAAGMSALGAAAKRIEKIGPRNAVEDKRMGELVRQAASHLSAAIHDEPKSQTRKLRNLALVGVLGVTAYLALKKESVW